MTEEYIVWLDVCRMNRCLRYLKVQLQRTAKVYPVILVFTVVMTVVMMLLLKSMFIADTNSVRTSKINIGLVGDTSETYLDIGFVAIQQLDSTRYYVEFVEFEDETEAAASLRSGGLFGYIVIPDGFVESIVSGENKKLTYVADNSPASFGPLLMNEIVKMVSDLIVEAQSGIYALWDVGEEADAENIQEFSDRLNLKYIAITLDRESFYTVEFIGIGEGLRLTTYYFHAFLILLMMLWGMVCVTLRVRTDMTMPRLVKFRGISSVRQTVCDFLPFFFVIYISVLILTVLAAIFGPNFGITAIDQPWTVAGWVLFAIKLIPAVAVISSLQYMLYEFCNNIISGVLIQLVSIIGLGYASGFFFPLSSYPLSIQKIAEFLPTRAAFSHTTTAFCNNDNELAVVLCLLQTVVFLGISVVVRSMRMRGSRQ